MIRRAQQSLAAMALVATGSCQSIPVSALAEEEDSPYQAEINGIKVYSNLEDFGRLEELMSTLEVTSEAFPELRGIGYYDSSEDPCSGYLYIFYDEIAINKCHEPARRLGYEGELFILAHELGHHVYNYKSDDERKQQWADRYAVRLLRAKGIPRRVDE